MKATMPTIFSVHGAGVECSSDSRQRVHARRILVADEDEVIRNVISTILAGAGFEVNTASDGQQAWEALLHEHYDLLVADNDIPGLAGIRLIERMRESGVTLPVIVTSGTLPVERARDYSPSQIAAVLPKPFRIFELLGAVKQVLLV